MSKKSPECAPHPWPHPLQVGALKRSGATPFDLRADATQRAAIASFLDLAQLRQLRWQGKIQPEGEDGWRLDARLTADLAQTCVVTLDPVPARIDQRVTRHFVPEEGDGGDGGGHEGTGSIDIDPDDALGEDDDPDTFSDVIDPGAVAIEVLALALDPYPRAAGTDPVELRATPPGATALDDAAMKPFSGLAALKAKMEGEPNG